MSSSSGTLTTLTSSISTCQSTTIIIAHHQSLAGASLATGSLIQAPNSAHVPPQASPARRAAREGPVRGLWPEEQELYDRTHSCYGGWCRYQGRCGRSWMTVRSTPRAEVAENATTRERAHPRAGMAGRSPTVRGGSSSHRWASETQASPQSIIAERHRRASPQSVTAERHRKEGAEGSHRLAPSGQFGFSLGPDIEGR